MPLTITLWDFSWYTRTGPDEPFADLDAAFAQAVERGYNTVRICAMPYLLFGSGLDTTALTFTGIGAGYGRGTRWYDLSTSATLDGREHLLKLFRAARRHDCRVIVSSWEYQQSPCFLADDSWHLALSAVPPEARVDALADALADCVDLLVEHGLDDRIAFVELHNEVQYSRLTEALAPGQSAVLGLQPSLERGIEAVKRRHPAHLVTANYAGVPVGELLDTFALRDPARAFPQDLAAEQLLVEGAPPLTEWAPAPRRGWKLDATIVGAREVYVHDWAAAHHVPLVFGEGWVGYTPLRASFEEGPVGAQFCRDAVDGARRAGAWGTVVCSNAAPHHPMWSDVALQKEINAAFAAGRTGR